MIDNPKAMHAAVIGSVFASLLVVWTPSAAFSERSIPQPEEIAAEQAATSSGTNPDSDNTGRNSYTTWSGFDYID